MSVALCAVLAGLALAVALPPAPRELLARRSTARTGRSSSPPAQPRGPVHRRWLVAATVLLAAAAVLLGPPGGGSPMALLLLLPSIWALWRVRAGRRAAAAAARAARSAVAEAAQVVAAELRAGRTPAAALTEAAVAAPALRAAASAAALGADVVPALRAAARTPGAAGLALLATGWQLTDRTGAPLAAVASRAAEAVRAEEAVRYEVAAQLAPVRSTARLMAALPLATMALGSALGGSPATVLLGTPWGAACGAGGAALAAFGVAWVDRIAADAERSPWAS